MKFKNTICLMAVCFCCGILAYHLLPRETVIEVNDSTPYISLEEMVVKADIIVTGNISDSGVSQWDNARDGRQMERIHTDVPIEPEEILSDPLEEANSDLEVRTYTGQIGSVSQISSSRPSLKKARKYCCSCKRTMTGRKNIMTLLGICRGNSH